MIFLSGTGYLSNILSMISGNVVSIDISPKSIEIARQKYPISSISFINTSVEDYSELLEEKFSLAVANMLFSCVLDLNNVLKSISSILTSNGHFIFTISHPCFWPIYWGYSSEVWYNYNEEIYIEVGFKTSLCGFLGNITHVHRPLEQYLSSLNNNGFKIEGFFELYSNDDEMKQKNNYPRFIGFDCCKIN